MERILLRGWLEEVSPQPGDRYVSYALTVGGIQALESCGADLAVGIPRAGRAAYGCLDWTERRQHLGGALGRVIVDNLCASGYISRSSGSREIEILRDVQNWLDESRFRR